MCLAKTYRRSDYLEELSIFESDIPLLEKDYKKMVRTNTLNVKGVLWCVMDHFNKKGWKVNKDYYIEKIKIKKNKAKVIVQCISEVGYFELNVKIE